MECTVMTRYCVTASATGTVPETASETQSTNVLLSIEHLPDKIIHDLRLIAEWLNSSRHTGDYLQAYAKIRAGIVVKSLERCVQIS